MKTIYIKHIGKTEGHNSFFAKLSRGAVAEAKLETQEGARLMEGLLKGRHYSDAPIITSRICGICPVVHNLTSIKTIEDAFNVKVTENIVVLRKIMELTQVIHSHTLHLYFLSLPDFFDISDDEEFVAKFKKEAKLMIDVREYSLKILECIAGRVVHPINSETGGFRVAPDYEILKILQNDYQSVLEKAIEFLGFIRKIKYPIFSRETEFISLSDPNEYAIYDGKMQVSGKRRTFNARAFVKELDEYQKIDEVVKKVKFDDKTFMVGAIARLNNNFGNLNANAKKEFKKCDIKLPTYNTFHNIIAQGVEVVHCVEEINKLIKMALTEKNGKAHVKVAPKAGEGVGTVEAPRGTLYHHYIFNNEGNMIRANIITPTAMFLGNLDEDLKYFLSEIKEKENKKRNRLILSLIRAYDPCISCATH